MKYSKIAGVVRWSGGTTVLSEGMSADDDHPLVVERPDLFTEEAPPAALRVVKRVGADVERATAKPGERRGGRRG